MLSVIGASEARKIHAKDQFGDNPKQRLVENHPVYMDTALLKTPSGQMLQKLKELRASINSNISGHGPFECQHVPVMESADVSKNSNDVVKPAPYFMEDLRPNSDTDDTSQSSASSVTYSATDEDSSESLSMGSYILKLQKFFLRQCYNSNPRWCSIEALQSGLHTDNKVHVR